MKDHDKARYFLDGLTLGEWWDIMDAERLAEKRGLSCQVIMDNRHYWWDRHIDAATKNYVCCRSQGMSEITFVHSLESFAFTVKKSSPIKLEGGFLVVEGHRIKFTDLSTTIS